MTVYAIFDPATRQPLGIEADGTVRGGGAVVFACSRREVAERLLADGAAEVDGRRLVLGRPADGLSVEGLAPVAATPPGRPPAPAADQPQDRLARAAEALASVGKLPPDLRAALDDLVANRRWYQGCGWDRGGATATRKAMRALEKRGFAESYEEESWSGTTPAWRPTEAGEAEAAS